ncbi:cytosolic thiouridylase subunit Ctu1 [Recurvomyces mirabilis]|nr:cytosolic thiouridylase subunit Ctu1 [Recurvomyces mirabilis]
MACHAAALLGWNSLTVRESDRSEMPPHICEICRTARAQILRPKNHARICAACFIDIFESETAETITSTSLFQPGERVAIGASGGKDSTVLASVLKTLNDRHGWGLDLVLLSIDEGITGYRDHSLEAVKRNSAELGLPLKIVSYEELYGWSMDQVVAQVGKKGNCTYCGVFRRQALDRGAAMLGVGHVVTGHNADDVAETVLMNLLRGDLPRLSRATSIVTSTPSAARGPEGSFTNVKRSKPLMYAYEKEIVLYAHHKKLDYFSTECIYSPEAFRGSARTLIKNLERIRPESILDVVRSGIDMAKLVPDAAGNCKSGCADKKRKQEAQAEQEEGEGGCGSGNGQDAGGEMAEMERKLWQDEKAEEDGMEVEIKMPMKAVNGQNHDRDIAASGPPTSALITPTSDQDHDRHTHLSIPDLETKQTTVPIRTKAEKKQGRKMGKDGIARPAQTLGQCERCGYLSSQAVCKACVLLEGLNKSRPRTGVEVGGGDG